MSWSHLTCACKPLSRALTGPQSKIESESHQELPYYHPGSISRIESEIILFDSCLLCAESLYLVFVEMISICSSQKSLPCYDKILSLQINFYLWQPVSLLSPSTLRCLVLHLRSMWPTCPLWWHWPQITSWTLYWMERCHPARSPTHSASWRSCIASCQSHPVHPWTPANWDFPPLHPHPFTWMTPTWTTWSGWNWPSQGQEVSLYQLPSSPPTSWTLTICSGTEKSWRTAASAMNHSPGRCSKGKEESWTLESLGESEYWHTIPREDGGLSQPLLNPVWSYWIPLRPGRNMS